MINVPRRLLLGRRRWLLYPGHLGLSRRRATQRLCGEVTRRAREHLGGIKDVARGDLGDTRGGFSACGPCELLLYDDRFGFKYLLPARSECGRTVVRFMRDVRFVCGLSKGRSDRSCLQRILTWRRALGTDENHWRRTKKRLRRKPPQDKLYSRRLHKNITSATAYQAIIGSISGIYIV